MVISSEFHMRQYRDDDHRKDTLQFSVQCSSTIKVSIQGNKFYFALTFNNIDISIDSNRALIGFQSVYLLSFCDWLLQ